MSTQTWFITGASSGLGASVANAALRAGHRVAVTARDKVRLEKLTEAHPDAVLPLSMDLTKPSEIKAAITTAEKWHGGIDVLVNNAALGYLVGPAELGTEAAQAGAVGGNPGAVLRLTFVTGQSTREIPIMNFGAIERARGVLG